MSSQGKITICILLIIVVALAIIAFFVPINLFQKAKEVSRPVIATKPISKPISKPIAKPIPILEEPVLSISADNAKIGESLNIGINLKNSPTSKISILEFAVDYDKDIFFAPQVKDTPILKQAQKTVASNVFEEEGVVKIIIYGLDQSSIEDGKIIEVDFKIKSDIEPTKTSMVIKGAAGASFDAKSVKLIGKAKEIDIVG